MKEMKPETMAEILELAKKLPKGSSMEIAMPNKGGMKKEMEYEKEDESEDEGEKCPTCGGPMKGKEMSGDYLKKMLKG